MKLVRPYYEMKFLHLKTYLEKAYLKIIVKFLLLVNID